MARARWSGGMKLRLHIERLVLDGLPVQSRHGAAVGREILRELERLLRKQGLGSHMKSSGAHWHVAGGELKISEKTTPETIGRDLAHRIYKGIGSREPGRKGRGK